MKKLTWKQAILQALQNLPNQQGDYNDVCNNILKNNLKTKTKTTANTVSSNLGALCADGKINKTKINKKFIYSLINQPVITQPIQPVINQSSNLLNNLLEDLVFKQLVSKINEDKLTKTHLEQLRNMVVETN